MLYTERMPCFGLDSNTGIRRGGGLRCQTGFSMLTDARGCALPLGRKQDPYARDNCGGVRCDDGAPGWDSRVRRGARGIRSFGGDPASPRHRGIGWLDWRKSVRVSDSTTSVELVVSIWLLRPRESPPCPQRHNCARATAGDIDSVCRGPSGSGADLHAPRESWSGSSRAERLACRGLVP